MIRKAVPSELNTIQHLVSQARGIMRGSGNHTQWTGGYPTDETLLSDMDRDGGFVVVREGQVVAYFAMFPSPDPTYLHIDGAWLYDKPYVVVHRLASGPETHGILHEVLEFAFAETGTVRIDTHEDNVIMRHLLEKEGFTHCGTIYLEDGSPRMAFEASIGRLVPKISTPE